MDIQVLLSALLGAILGGVFLAIIVFTWDALDRLDSIRQTLAALI